MNTIIPFQKGIIISNISLKLLFASLTRRYDLKYLLTYRLNQNVLENFFSVLRAKGGLPYCPDPLEFRYRLRSYLMGRNESYLSIASNVEVDDTPDLSRIEINLRGACFAPLEVEEESFGTIENDIPELSDQHYDGLENLASFICKKVKEPTSYITSNSTSGSFTWIDHLSEGGLQKPTQHFMMEIEKLEAIFDSVNKPDLLISKHYLKNLFDRSVEVDCRDSV